MPSEPAMLGARRSPGGEVGERAATREPADTPLLAPSAPAGDPALSEAATIAQTASALSSALAIGTTAANCPLPAVPSRVLIIGYGNSLFADDGVGPLVAQQVADWCVPGVLALERHELVPELAADVAAAQEAIFVDAAIAGERVTLARVEFEPNHTHARLDHALTPAGLLALAQFCFGRAPRAWMLTVPGVDFSLGAALSETARRGIAEALEMLRARV